MSQQTTGNRPSRFARRAVAVSAGAFALCLAGATPAMADLDPVPLPDLSPVTDALSPVTDVVEPVAPVKETVEDAEKPLGETDTTTSGPKTRTPKPTTADGDTSTTPTRDGATRHREQRKEFRLPGPADVSPAYVPTWTDASSMPGLRSAFAAAAAAAEPPAVAAPAKPEHSVISLAGEGLKDLGDAGTPAGRTLLVIIATMIIGSLAGGHVKTAQDRLMATTA